MADDPNATAMERQVSGAAGGPVTLRGSFKIYPTIPLPELNTLYAEAFSAESTKTPDDPFFALVCHPHALPRTDAFNIFRGNSFSHLLTLREWGSVFWPPSGQHVTVLVYDRPMGGRLSDILAAGEQKINPHDAAKDFIEPFVAFARDISTRGVPHRNIRPDNIFFLDEARTTWALGDCLTSPPGACQPFVFEPIEQSMCLPAGRGRSNAAADLYAFGVTLVYLLCDHDPIKKKNDQQILDSKISHGSYMTIAGDEKIAINLLEPLRGLLSDDAQQRWTHEELELWIDGRRLTPQQKQAAPSAERGFMIDRHEYKSLRPLAIAMLRNTKEASKRIKDGSLETWLQRGLEDGDTAQAVREAAQFVSTYSSDPVVADEIMVSRVCMILDPAAPIRYRGFSFMPEGFGPAMAVEFLEKGNAQIPIEVIKHDVVQHWFEAQGTIMAAFSGERKQFTQLKSFLSFTEPGYGIERCLYTMVQGLHCLSPLIVNYHVMTIDTLLTSLDMAAKTADKSKPPIDRHICAFIAARFGHDVESHLTAFSSPEPEISTLGMLSLLAIVQWRYRTPPLTELANWIGGLLGPALEVYHSKTTRREVEAEIPRVVRRGSLPELYNLLDNKERRKLDEMDFQSALREYALARKEIEELSSTEIQGEKAEHMGQQSAAITSIIISLLIVTATYLMTKV